MIREERRKEIEGWKAASVRGAGTFGGGGLTLLISGIVVHIGTVLLVGRAVTGVSSITCDIVEEELTK